MRVRTLPCAPIAMANLATLSPLAASRMTSRSESPERQIEFLHLDTQLLRQFPRSFGPLGQILDGADALFGPVDRANEQHVILRSVTHNSGRSNGGMSAALKGASARPDEAARTNRLHHCQTMCRGAVPAPSHTARRHSIAQPFLKKNRRNDRRLLQSNSSGGLEAWQRRHHRTSRVSSAPTRARPPATVKRESCLDDARLFAASLRNGSGERVTGRIHRTVEIVARDALAARGPRRAAGDCLVMQYDTSMIVHRSTNGAGRPGRPC